MSIAGLASTSWPKGYDAQEFRQHSNCMMPVIERKAPGMTGICTGSVECFIKIKHYRRIFSRLKDTRYLGFLHFTGSHLATVKCQQP